jgi:hypothetical protein
VKKEEEVGPSMAVKEDESNGGDSSFCSEYDFWDKYIRVKSFKLG